MSDDTPTVSTILYQKTDGVATVTLNRPDDANAIDLQMSKDLLTVALDCDEDPSVRCVVLRATGKMFCAGGDLAAFSKAGDGMPRLLKEMTVYLHGAIGRFARMRAPVIAAVGGTAAGAGFSLVCAADLVIATESARLTMAYTRAGLTPDGSSTFFLPRLIGARRTEELMITNRVLDAEEALNWGVINEVVPGAELLARGEEIAEKLAAGATQAFGRVRRLLLRSFNSDLHSQLNEESKAISDMTRTEDAKEGIKAFIEKRPPTFKGK